MYAKRNFVFLSHVYFFIQKPLPLDTTVDIDDIDSVNYPNIKEDFKLFVNKFSKCYFHRTHPIDSLDLKNPVFILFFNQYHIVDSVIKYLNNIDSIWAVDSICCWGVLSVEDSIHHDYKLFILVPQLNNEYIKIIINNEFSNYPVNYYLYDYRGNLMKSSVLSNNETNVKINEFTNGLYFIKIKNNVIPFFILR